MIQPVKRDSELLAEIDLSPAVTPTLWWLGHSGFAMKYGGIVFYVDPFLGPAPRGRTRLMESPLKGHEIRHADMVLATHTHFSHLDPGAIPQILHASRRARLVLPKSGAGHAHAIGVGYERMTTTDADLPVEYSKDEQAARIDSIPSAHNELKRTPDGGYRYLGYLIRFGEHVIYHSGDCVPYEGLADRLRPYRVSVALLPISGRSGDGAPENFQVAEAAQLAEEIGARWIVPMHYGMFEDSTVDINRFIEHMLGHRPSQRFKVFQCGEGWTLPDEADAPY